ncbi:hypothetical protein C8Q80DRAFT_1126096 [Daedaleopsis nitida]|nr:hypothetical protein C8Q80DRAFT_1126096 [Daedaleopsis nitida]
MRNARLPLLVSAFLSCRFETLYGSFLPSSNYSHLCIHGLVCTSRPMYVLTQTSWRLNPLNTRSAGGSHSLLRHDSLESSYRLCYTGTTFRRYENVERCRRTRCGAILRAPSRWKHPSTPVRPSSGLYVSPARPRRARRRGYSGDTATRRRRQQWHRHGQNRQDRRRSRRRPSPCHCWRRGDAPNPRLHVDRRGWRKPRGDDTVRLLRRIYWSAVLGLSVRRGHDRSPGCH